MSPEVKVNMDSRNDVYGEELYMEYVNALRSPEAMKVYLSRHPIDFFLLSYADRVSVVFDPLEASGEWAPIYYDSRAFIVVKRKPETEDLIRREGFHYIRPAVITPTAVSSENAPMVLEEADRLIRNCPTALFGWFYRTKALLMLQRFEDSLETSRKAATLQPDNPQAYADMGAAYLGLGQRDRAVEMFEKAVDLDPGFTQARETLRRLRGF
jgi:tetratricopeptide (TPR) repeat protein